jgi:Family of unknown function (DUF6152)
MTARTVYALVVAAAAVVVAGRAPLEAHHSFAAEYDGNQPITLTGTVTKIEWTNPHFYFYVDVKAESGATTSWKFEGYPPNMLIRQGWKRDVTLKPGDAVTVFGWRARADANLAAARQVTFSDGHKLAAGPPAGTGGQ